MRALLRWLADWRVGLVITGSVLVAVLTGWVITTAQSRSEALDALKAQTRQALDAREAASRRIDQLQQRIDTLERQHGQDAGQIAALRDEVEVLRRQARAAGLVEVVEPGQVDRVAPRTEPDSSSQPSSPSPSPHSSRKPSPSPSPRSSPSPSPSLCVLVVCVQ